MDFESQVAAFALMLQAEGTAQRAEHEKAYLKSDLKFYGAAVPVIDRVAKTFRKSHPDLTHGELLGLVEALWQTEYHETRSLGIALLEAYPKLITSADGGFLESLLRRMQTWAHIDWIATGTIAQLIERDPTVKATLATWATDESFWIRRTAMLALLKRARFHREDFDLFAQFAASMITEPEFFIRKAIGWVLREVSKRQPDWVYEFLTAHLHQVSGLTLREGAKYLPEAQREALMAQYKTRKSKGKG